MRDVTDKPESRRTAVAESAVRFPPEFTPLVRDGTADKGDILPVARVAGILAAKRCHELIPLCHPLPLTHVGVSFEIGDGVLAVRAVVRTVSPTGVEMEALTAVSVAALTAYDMLKPHTTDLTIGPTRLVDKRGGKSDPDAAPPAGVRARVLVLSDSVSSGTSEDRSGPAVREELTGHGVAVTGIDVIADDREAIERRVREIVDSGSEQLDVAVGGTGCGPRDVTADAIRPLLDRELPGVAETMRAFGQRRVRTSMLSRSVAGFSGGTLVVTLPGSVGGAVESCRALLPALLHAFHVSRGGGHGVA